jgi:hypothetical protein
MVHIHFFFYLYHLGFIHASVCILLACGLLKVSRVCLLDILLMPTFILTLCQMFFHNVRGMS